MRIDSLVVSWNSAKEQYTITILTEKDGLVANFAKDMRGVITVINELEEKYAT